MVRHGRFALIAVIMLAALAGCGELHPPSQGRYVTYHTVRSGDTLYSIAWRYGYDYREVAAWNRIAYPYRIYVGQRLLIIPPSRGSAPIERSASSTASAPNNRSAPVRTSPTTRAAPAPKTVEKPAPRPNTGPIAWRWPTSGSVKRGFADSDSKKGLDISGKIGQPVYAAADGDVVYSGSGLVGYGNLVIIKHDDVFLSAYGNNRRLLVKEGESVKSGQMIAEMGQTGKDGAILHFEIRQEGKPVDPIRYLPRRNM